MATRLKTVEYAMPVLDSMTDNSLTAMTQRTIYLPEAPSGSAFTKVMAYITAMPTATSGGASNTPRLDVSVGGAGATTYTGQTYTSSAEDMFVTWATDVTSHFVTNWTTGTSKTVDCSLLMHYTGGTPVWTNINVVFYITYEYDDTSTTQLKTVRIPVDMGNGFLGTSKSTVYDTIPALDTELPEASKTYRDVFFTFQATRQSNTTTDSTLSFELDSTGAKTTGVYEGNLATNYNMRYVWPMNPVINTASSMSFYAWSDTANMWGHTQGWVTVTYEFDSTSSNDMFVSLMLPMEVQSPMGGTTSSDYQRGTREVFIEEPSTITTKNIAFYAFWEQSAPLTTPYMRIGTGSFVSYANDTAGVLAGSNCAMIVNDSAFTLARGRNKLNWDIYRTDTADLGYNLCGFWILNYTAGKPTDGYGAANHTVLYNLGMYMNATGNFIQTTSAVAPSIPETDYFITAVGTRGINIVSGGSNSFGTTFQAEKTAAEGGVEWISSYTDIGASDPEIGARHSYSQMRNVFKRFTGDADPDRLDIETSRRWRATIGSVSAAFFYLDLMFTYHTITKTVSGNITGFTGTVDLSLHRSSDNTDEPGQLLQTTTRSGDGSYSFTWYDDTENVFVEATDGTNVGRTTDGTAS